jgi:hypothetical protein
MSITQQDTTIIERAVNHRPFTDHVEVVRVQVAGQLLLSQARCVDQLLDLLTLSTEPAVRTELGGLLAEISRLSAVRADRLVEVLDLCLAALDVESAFAHLVL